MLCLILLILLLTRRSWCGYSPYSYGYYGPYPYPYGAYTPYDPYWRMRYYDYRYGYRRGYW